ncbi:MAG: peptidoglycan DD-metalloendopeptidase family protein [Bacilli bacterium]|nr:peptidoglycan DD-metalloendopeptidase family protein [Bacilli bacterium]
MKKFKNIILVLLLIATAVTGPISVNAKAAETLGDLRNELKALEKEKKDYENKKNSTKAEINNKSEAVKQANDDIIKAENDIEAAKIKIAESQEEITKISAETEELLRFMQVMNGENAYLEYITGASSMTEMIQRLKAVDQITTYNREQLDNLKDLIKKNEQLQVDLAAKQVELESKIVEYEKRISSLGKDLSELAEISEDIDDQIKNQKALIRSYEDMGCKEDQKLSACVDIAKNAGWLKPLVKGRVTSLWGYRIHPTKGTYKFHNGIDLGIGEGTKIYSAASGTVAAITKKSSCGGNKVYVHSYVNGKAYTHYYFHLLDIKVKVGDKVSTDTIIGTVGGGKSTQSYDKCTTGAHLHFGIAKGFYLGGGKEGYSSYSKFTSNSINPPGFPGKGVWFYSR